MYVCILYVCMYVMYKLMKNERAKYLNNNQMTHFINFALGSSLLYLKLFSGGNYYFHYKHTIMSI